MMKEILCVKNADDDGSWAIYSHVTIAGNYTLERFLSELQKEIDTKNEKPYSHYLWKVEAKKYDLDNTLLEECDRWHLSRHEVFTAPVDSKYQAIVMLYYQPAVKVAIAV